MRILREKRAFINSSCNIALHQGHVDSCVQLIKAIESNSLQVKVTNLRAMVVNTATSFDILTEIINQTVDIVSKWLEEKRQAVDGESGFLHFLAMTMKAKNCKDWFNPNDKGEYQQFTKIVMFMI